MDLSRRLSSIPRSAAFALVFLALCGMTDVTQAASGWTVSNIEGTALKLNQGHWEELSAGEPIELSNVVRTLRDGTMDLRRGGVGLRLLPGSAMILGSTNASGGVSIEQYSGGVVASLAGNTASVTVRTPTLVAVLTEGTASVLLDGNDVEVVSASGIAAVTFVATGASITVAARQTLTVTAADKVVLANADGETIAAGNVNEVAFATKTKGAGGDDATNGNAGGNGNGGGNGSGAVNGSPNGSGNGGGNGNGNGGNNGNSNGESGGNGKSKNK